MSGEIGEETLPEGALVSAGAGAPGVVLVHDVWGLADHTKDMARRLAAEPPPADWDGSLRLTSK